MSLTLNLPPELEAEVRKAADREGVPLDTFAVAALEERLRRDPDPEETEASLLAQIGAGLPPATWERYHTLCAKRRDETLSDDEYAELLRLTGEVEEWNVRRLELVVRLAELRCLPPSELAREMGFAPASSL